jgi:FdhE protein
MQKTHAIDSQPSIADAPALLLPDLATLFARRAERFAALGVGHSLGDWLAFLGRLTRAQHDIASTAPMPALPDAAALEQARHHAMPPLARRPVAWRDVLRQLAGRLSEDASPAAPPATQLALAALLAAADDDLEQLADALQSGEPSAEQAARLPFVAAALQIVFTAQASQLDARLVPALDAHGLCPCCGSLPVASIVRTGAAINNLRYLHCALCNSEWKVARVICTSCATDKGVALQQLAGGNGAVRAETCDSCKSYLKIVYQEKDSEVDPVADDLATLALDLLVDEAGYSRSGPNLLLITPSNQSSG